MPIRKVHVYGLGAIGSNLLVQLAKQKPDLEYVGYDFDKVEPRNIGPQAYFLEHVGMPKGTALRIVLQRYLRNAKYTYVAGRVEKPVSDAPDDTLILDCFDNSESRQLLAQTKGHVLHVGFSPLYTAEAVWNPQYTVPGPLPKDAPDLCTLSNAASYIAYVVNTVAMQLIDFITTGEKRSVIVSHQKSRVFATHLL